MNEPIDYLPSAGIKDRPTIQDNLDKMALYRKQQNRSPGGAVHLTYRGKGYCVLNGESVQAAMMWLINSFENDSWWKKLLRR